MCWQKFILFSLVQKGVFMTILRRTVLGIQWSVNKCFGWSEKSLIIIYGYVSNKNGLHFIQDIPTCIVLTKIRFDHTGTEMACWVHMIPFLNFRSMHGSPRSPNNSGYLIRPELLINDYKNHSNCLSMLYSAKCVDKNYVFLTFHV